jgi:hypothetical protein
MRSRKWRCGSPTGQEPWRSGFASVRTSWPSARPRRAASIWPLDAPTPQPPTTATRSHPGRGSEKHRPARRLAPGHRSRRAARARTSSRIGGSNGLPCHNTFVRMAGLPRASFVQGENAASIHLGVAGRRSADRIAAAKPGMLTFADKRRRSRRCKLRPKQASRAPLRRRRASTSPVGAPYSPASKRALAGRDIANPHKRPPVGRGRPASPKAGRQTITVLFKNTCRALAVAEQR